MTSTRIFAKSGPSLSCGRETGGARSARSAVHCVLHRLALRLRRGIVWARRITVEQRQWINEEEFADIVSLCQFMPGPNIVGIAVCVGAKLRGVSGAFAAVSGFVMIPGTIGFMLGVLYLQHAHFAVVQNILGGVSAAAAGLLIATGIRMLVPCRGRPVALVFAALAFGLMTFSKLPLLVVLFGLIPLNIVVTGIGNARVR